MRDALAWFNRSVSCARVQTERENLLCELDDCELYLGDLAWQSDVTRKRKSEIQSRLYVLDGVDRRKLSERHEPSPTAAVIRDEFAARHPEMAEIIRLRREADFDDGKWSAEVRNREAIEQVKP